MSDEDDFRLKAKARKSSSRGAEVNIPANYKGFHQGVRAALDRPLWYACVAKTSYKEVEEAHQKPCSWRWQD
jgi:hypothetical protein